MNQIKLLAVTLVIVSTILLQGVPVVALAEETSDDTEIEVTESKPEDDTEDEPEENSDNISYNKYVKTDSTVLAGASKDLQETLYDVVSDADNESEENEECTEEDNQEEVKNYNWKTGYTNTAVRIRENPTTDSDILTVLSINKEIQFTKDDIHGNWVHVKYGDILGYMVLKYISNEKTKIVEKTNKSKEYAWSGKKLNARAGTVYGPSGRETFYNLPMGRIVSMMHSRGYNGDYWVRDDGAKMLGQYVMVAADLSIHPRGSVVPTTLGYGLVCDTGGFAHNGSGVALDVATNW